jgi:hypothetical protein
MPSEIEVSIYCETVTNVWIVTHRDNFTFLLLPEAFVKSTRLHNITSHKTVITVNLHVSLWWVRHLLRQNAFLHVTFLQSGADVSASVFHYGIPTLIRLIAYITNIWFISGMTSSVFDKMGTLAEWFIAYFTNVWPLSRVTTTMFGKMANLKESFPTWATSVRSFSSVDATMPS